MSDCAWGKVSALIRQTMTHQKSTNQKPRSEYPHNSNWEEKKSQFRENHVNLNLTGFNGKIKNFKVGIFLLISVSTFQGQTELCLF